MSVLSELPPRTPIWAIGLVTIIVAFTFGVITIYASIRNEVQDVIKEKSLATTGSLDIQKSMTTSILGLVSSQGDQIVMLSQQLKIAEVDIAQLKDDLGTCKDKLKSCKKF